MGNQNRRASTSSDQIDFVRLDDKLSYRPRTQAEKLQRLLTIKPFVLDNSLRETSVAQIRGHTLENKDTIFDAIKQSGLSEVIVASFGDLKRVDDQWLEKKKGEGKIEKNFWAFSEMWETFNEAKSPKMCDPMGLKKIKLYGIENIIFEISFGDINVDWLHFTATNLCQYVKKRITDFRSEVSATGRILINYRDGVVAWDYPERNYEKRMTMIRLTQFLGSLPPETRPFGLIFEEPGGTTFPWQITGVVEGIRAAQLSVGWREAQWLIHVHKGYGFHESVVMEALSSGCSGIWCAICEEGAGVGHACSLLTLTNLARMGNEWVAKNFDFHALRLTAIAITKASIGDCPPAKQELYGARAVDIVFDASSGMGSTFDISEFFGLKKQTRVTTFTTPEMFMNRLSEVFGPNKWNRDVAIQMRVLLEADLRDGFKYTYQTPSGLFDLYVRAGGKDHVNEMESLIISRESIIGEQFRLISDLKEYFDAYVDPDELNNSDGSNHALSHRAFYNAFLSRYLPCYTCEKFHAVMSFLDANKDGKIEWQEIEVWAKWAIEESPKCADKWTLERLLKVIFEDHILPTVFHLHHQQNIQNDLTGNANKSQLLYKKVKPSTLLAPRRKSFA